MKKFTAFAAAVIMALSMTACIDKEKSSAKEQESSSNEKAEQTVVDEKRSEEEQDRISSAAESQDENSETSQEDLLKEVNLAAEMGYNLTSEYLADMEFMEKLSEASADEAAKKAAEELSSDGYSGIVGVKLIDLNECNFQVFWHSDKNPEIVGRYPDCPRSVDECPEWDVDAEYKCSEKPRMKNSKKETEKHTKIEPELKTAITNAKTAYSAVEVYIGDMETKGELSEVTEQSAADVAAAMLKDYEISGIIGVTITDLYHEYPQFEVFWRESEDSNIVGKYPYPPQSVDDCPEWDVGAYSYVK